MMLLVAGFFRLTLSPRSYLDRLTSIYSVLLGAAQHNSSPLFPSPSMERGRGAGGEGVRRKEKRKKIQVVLV